MDVIHEVTKNANFISKTEYKVNKFLSLKLEYKRTVIFVGGKRFRNCKYLLLNLNTLEQERMETINSIDQVAEALNHDLHGNFSTNKQINPQEEFWGHCSNLQAWYENNYDSRLLHSNLAFPLLKQLAKEGDPQARKAFKEEIAKRIESEYPNVVQYLIKEGYLKYLGVEELKYLKEKIKNYKISKIIGKFFYKKEIFKSAALFLERTLELNPKDQECQELLREIYETDEEKIARYLRTLEEEPNRRKLKAKLIVLYTQRNEFKNAMSILNKDSLTEHTKETYELMKAIRRLEKNTLIKNSIIWSQVCIKLIQILALKSNPILMRYIYKNINIGNQIQYISKDVVNLSKKALERSENDLEIKANVGKIFYILNQYNDATQIFNELIRLTQKNREYKLQLGKIYIKTKKYKQAIEILKDFEWDTIKSLNFKNIFKNDEFKFYLFSFWKAIGNFFYQQENYYKAIEVYHDLLDYDTESFFLRTVQELTILNRLITCYKKTNQIERIYELMDIELSEYGRKEKFPNNYFKFIKKYSS
ncbi:MAG: hypothetical protein EU541_05360 [Promethearchaeota archaeon]|nr:MAG: hypothetical protein EU541_05360 [Candidatus Lokiarchaeota archaeon]